MDIRPHMTTTFRLIPDKNPLDLKLGHLQASLPPSMKVSEKHDGFYVTVKSTTDEDESVQPLIDREVDRIQFLTLVRFRAEMCRRSVTANFASSYRVHGSLSPDVMPLIWTENLALQFRLWNLASGASDPMIRILLHYQIIELTYPDNQSVDAYPPYQGGGASPHPRTEAKLLRHLVAHAGEAKRETSLYLQYLGLPAKLGNVTHAEWASKIAPAARRVEKLAYVLLRSAA